MASRDQIGVAAIDFGTTFSGWAYSFRHDYEKEPTKVYARNWSSGEHISPKTPTAILVKPDGKTLEAFGYDAENKYIALAEEDGHNDYYFFYRFKMLLNKQKAITRRMKLETVDGKQLLAIVVFKLAIAFLKDDLLRECETKLTGGITVSDIHWTLTVPTIWNEKAKKFMREAAVMAGLEDQNLTIALEPESASTFCRRLPMERSYGGHISSLESGSAYILIDCGGGTTDICCHRIMEDGRLKEIFRADGEAVGGTDVDKAFEDFLVKIFGCHVWNEFKRNNVGDALSLFRSFEVKKREVKPQGGDPITFSLPVELISLLRERSDRNLQDAVTLAGFHDDIKVLRGNKIKVNADCFIQNIYDEVIDRFRSVLMKHFGRWKMKDIQTVLMVGGFSESAIIQDVARQTIPVREVITIQEPSIAVVKGAVIYGHDESMIQVRIARYTYGKDNIIKFSTKIHDYRKSYLDESGVRLVRLFRPIVLAGDKLPACREIDGGICVPFFEDAAGIGISIHAVDEEDDIPTYAEDPRCIELGQIVIPVTNMKVPLFDRKFRLNLKFGDTEIKATSTEMLTGNVVQANIDFLG